MMKKTAVAAIIFVFIANSVLSPSIGMGQILSGGMVLPEPGTMVHLTATMTPAYLKGMVIDPNNPFKFDFIVFRGDKPLTYAQKQEEYTKLIKYFLAALAVPDENQWVNLSPYEKDRIIPKDFGLTEMGRDLLGQDYILKQLSSSLTYPESALGKKFWSKVYTETQKKFGTTNVPTSTFNKVWILPDKAVVYEKGNTVYVLENHLKVMMEEDYLALSHHVIPAKNVSTFTSHIMREVIIPVIEKEVNEGANFAPLRQVFSGMLLATWYKRELKESILGRLYADKGKVKGIDQNLRTNNESIYQEYLKAFKKGVFNMIKEDFDPQTQQVIPRKYFAGGTKGYVYTPLTHAAMMPSDEAMKTQKEDLVDTDLMQPQRANTVMKSFDAAQVSKIREAVNDFKTRLQSVPDASINEELLMPFEELIDKWMMEILSAGFETGAMESERITETFMDQWVPAMREINKALISRGYLVLWLPELRPDGYYFSVPLEKKLALLKIAEHRTYRVRGNKFTIFWTRNTTAFPIPLDKMWESAQSLANPYGILFLPSIEKERDRILAAVKNPQFKYFNVPIVHEERDPEATRILRDIEYEVNTYVSTSFKTTDSKTIDNALIDHEISSMLLLRMLGHLGDNSSLWQSLVALYGISQGRAGFILPHLIQTFISKFYQQEITFEPNIFYVVDPTSSLSDHALLRNIPPMLRRVKKTSNVIIQRNALDAFIQVLRRFGHFMGEPGMGLPVQPVETESLQDVADRIKVGGDAAMASKIGGKPDNIQPVEPPKPVDNQARRSEFEQILQRQLAANNRVPSSQKPFPANTVQGPAQPRKLSGAYIIQVAIGNQRSRNSGPSSGSLAENRSGPSPGAASQPPKARGAEIPKPTQRVASQLPKPPGASAKKGSQEKSKPIDKKIPEFEQKPKMPSIKEKLANITKPAREQRGYEESLPHMVPGTKESHQILTEAQVRAREWLEKHTPFTISNAVAPEIKGSHEILTEAQVRAREWLETHTPFTISNAAAPETKGSHEILTEAQMRTREWLEKHTPFTISAESTPDKAMETVVRGSPFGGIDMNSANLAMLVKRDGKGMVLPMAQQHLENIHIDGLVPVIRWIRSAANLSIFSTLSVSHR